MKIDEFKIKGIDVLKESQSAQMEVAEFLESDVFKDKLKAEEQRKDFEAIKDALKRSKEGGVVLEVLYEALNSLKSNPNQSIQKAMYDALWEWDC
ncbi:hypothetical protein [Chryseobacterium indologenes]|uniref:hypothetical protein n=1 Tax=Chryseobacterium indologenes TaxID=253 RepID=UPI0009A160BE|nr:hypothetical protein [Chryseobacterium indologenes]